MRRSLKSLFCKLAPLGSKRYFISQGIIRFFRRKFLSRNIAYQKWINKYDSALNHRGQQRLASFDQAPGSIKFSILMPVYNPPLKLLDESIQSVRDQVHTNWELCIADDASTLQKVRGLISKHAGEDDRIRFTFREENGNISAASNSALELATGDYVVLFDHDDKLHPLAIYYAAQIISRNADAEIIYADRDKITVRGDRYDPYFKPEFDYELLLCHNFISHLDIYKLDTVRKVGGFRRGLEGSQDYDLLLRVLEQIRPEQIHHIPKVLYHWRATSQSVAENINIKPYAIEAGERALNDHLTRIHLEGRVLYNPDFTGYQVEYVLPIPHPSVELIIIGGYGGINRENILSLLQETRYGTFTVTIALQGEEIDPGLEELIINPKVSIRMVSSRDNFPQILNERVFASDAEFIGVLDGDLQGFSPGWLEKLLSQAAQDGIGVVGPKLLDERGLVYSNGIILGSGKVATHLFRGKSEDYLGYFGWGQLRRGYSAISGKCSLLRKGAFLCAKGLDMQYNTAEFAWIDFCLRLKQCGLRNVICPSVRLRFSSEQSGGNGEEEIQVDENGLLKKWSDFISHDPAFNQNLSLRRGKITINLDENDRF